ncbi:MAG: hypothetical protein ROR55_19915 [Devosia sp.]
MGDEEEPKLSVIEGGGEGPKPWARRSLDEWEQVSCWRCEKAGRGPQSTFLPFATSPRRDTQGNVFVNEQLICMHCFLRDGEVVTLKGKALRIKLFMYPNHSHD